MNCSKCNAPIPDDSAFCPECGTKAEPVQPAAPEQAANQVFCPECGAALLPGDVFCESCGAKVDVPAAPAKKFSFKALLASFAALPKKAKLIAGGAVALVVLVVVLVAIFAGGNNLPNYALYVKDGDLFGAQMPNGKPLELSDDISSSNIAMTKDGKKIFFLEGEDSKLMWRATTGKKDATSLAKNVSSFKINAAGTKAFYMKEGTLYVHNMKDSTKIAGDVSSYRISADGNTVVYITRTEDTETLYRKSGNKDPKKIASGEDLYLEEISENLNLIVYTVDGDLYTQTGTKDPQKVASDADIRGSLYNNKAFYYVTEEETDDGYDRSLHYWDGSKGTKVSDDFTGIESYARDKAVLIFYFREEDADEYTYKLAVGAKVSDTDLDEVYSMNLSPDGTEVMYLTDYDEEARTGTLYKASISGNKVKAGKKVADDASTMFGYMDKGKAIHLTDYDREKGEGTLYLNGKKLADDVSMNHLGYIEDTKMLVFMTDVNEAGEGSLYVCTGSTAKKVNDDVSKMSYTPAGKLMYIHDANDKGEGTLYLYTGSGKGKKIDDDVTRIIMPMIPTEAY